MSDYVGAIDQLELRRDTIEAAIAELVPASAWTQTVARLRCLRGIDTLSAVGLAAEIAEFQRFEHPRPADELPRDGPLRAQHRRHLQCSAIHSNVVSEVVAVHNARP